LAACSVEDTIPDEALQNVVTRMLQLTASASGEMVAHRVDVVRSAFGQSAFAHPISRYRSRNMLTIRSCTIALRGDAYDF